jgi:hypothetical protein
MKTIAPYLAEAIKVMVERDRKSPRFDTSTEWKKGTVDLIPIEERSGIRYFRGGCRTSKGTETKPTVHQTEHEGLWKGLRKMAEFEIFKPGTETNPCQRKPKKSKRRRKK